MGGETTANEAPLRPWDPASRKIAAWKRIFGRLAQAAMVVVMLICFSVLMIPILDLLEKGKNIRAGEVVTNILIALVALGLFAACIIGCAVIGGRLSAGKRGPVVQCGRAPIYLTTACFWRQFSGKGDFEFSPGRLNLVGTLGPSLLPPVLVFLALNAVSLVVVLMGGKALFLFGGVLFFVVYYYALRRQAEVPVERHNIERVFCNGPVVTIRFRNPPVAQLKSVRLFVNERMRDFFFRQFEVEFPGTLPEEYAAAARLQAVTPPLPDGS